MNETEKVIPENLITGYMQNSISPQELDFCVWVLHCVYGWDLQKIHKFKLNTLFRYVKYSKKHLTVEKIRAINAWFDKPKKKETLWQKITKK